MQALYIYERLVSLDNPFNTIGKQVGIITGKNDFDCIEKVKKSNSLKHTFNNDKFVYSFEALK